MSILRRSHASRSTRSLVLIVAATLLLTLGQVAATSAQTASQRIATGYFDTVQGNSVISFISPHSVLHTPEGSFAGASSPTRFGAGLEASFSNLTFATRSSETVGEYVVVEFTLTGIHTGTYRDLAPACSAVSVPGVAILHAEETGITQQWISYDPGTLLSQIDAFSQIDASSRPTCEGPAPVQPPVADLGPASLCLDLDSCSYMP